MEQYIIKFDASEKKYDSLFGIIMMLNTMKIRIVSTLILQYSKVDTGTSEFLLEPELALVVVETDNLDFLLTRFGN